MKLLQIKLENILTIIYTPFLLINVFKANSNLFLVAFVLQLSLLAVTYYGIKNTRQEIIADIRNGEYEDLIEEINRIKAVIKALVKGIVTTYLDIKKEVTQKQPKTTKLEDAYLKYNF